jgi:hypothetical protein
MGIGAAGRPQGLIAVVIHAHGPILRALGLRGLKLYCSDDMILPPVWKDAIRTMDNRSPEGVRDIGGLYAAD